MQNTENVITDDVRLYNFTQSDYSMLFASFLYQFFVIEKRSLDNAK